MNEELSNIEAQARVIDRDIMTAEDKEQAERDVSGESDSKWNSARLSLRLQEETEGELSKGAVRLAVARRYHCSDGTIRRREKAARLVSPELQAAYPILTFTYWRTIVDADDMYAILAQVMGEYEAREELPTVNEVEGWVYGDGNSSAMPWRLRFEGVIDTLEKNKVDAYLHPDGRSLAGYCQALIQSYLDTGISPLSKPFKP
jgi:hypothetical protein